MLFGKVLLEFEAARRAVESICIERHALTTPRLGFWPLVYDWEQDENAYEHGESKYADKCFFHGAFPSLPNYSGVAALPGKYVDLSIFVNCPGWFGLGTPKPYRLFQRIPSSKKN
jgi:hypothetical protein